jgi:hypothetical protein
MLPKPEKNKSINNLLADSKITTENQAEISQKRLKFKRRLILISLILTAGISLIFWTVRFTQKIIKSPPSLNFNFKINLPKLSFKTTSKTNFSDSEIKKMLASKNWSVIAVFTSNISTPVFQSNYSSDINSVVLDLSKIKTSTQSLINLDLPQGLSFQEKISTSPGFVYQNLISLPNNKLVISVISPTDNIESVKSELTSLVNSIYWYSVAHLK